ncbi:hypothetical protein [Sandaracinus amylolyticus]|uniref:hypothetical protein n=1 Tax=Sandaracinus amylolyticus TaxID=927083 RepID=UPI001F3966B3|nr:hypothetical protein [Sandaracinus amylolyticus]UJR79813.1 Cell surface protein [Sandaracinus amylolyticus]
MARTPPERRARIDDRLTDPPEPSGGRRLAIGCGVALVAIALLAGGLGLVAGAWTRFAQPALDTSDDAPIPADPGVSAPSDPAVPRPSGDPLAEMRRRYVPSPHVRVEGMIPSDRALGRTPLPQPWQSGRSADTPWTVHGALYQPGPPPGASGQPAPRIGHDVGEQPDRPLTILAGVPAEARVRAADASGGPGVTSYAIAFDGYRGHFVLPATVPTELGVVSASGSDGATVRFTIGAPIRQDGTLASSGQPFRVIARIAAIDDQGRMSPWITRELSVLPVGTGDVEVALTMSEATDLDLYVTDPTGNTVYFGNTTGVSGGHLDLDANAACSGNLGVDNEHVYWPTGRAPRGTYSVRVAHYESCIQGRPVDYRITVRNCGETVVLSGRFAGGARPEQCLSNGQDPSWCQDVVSFVVPPCAPPNGP